MAAEPTIPVTLRLPLKVHALLKAVSEKDCRSMTKTVEWLIVRHCAESGIALEAPKPQAKRKARS